MKKYNNQNKKDSCKHSVDPVIHIFSHVTVRALIFVTYNR